MDYMSIANSTLMYILIIIGIGFVLLQSAMHLKMALGRAKEINMDKRKIKNTMKSAAAFSVVPTLPIVVALITLIPVFGTPWPWFRLSVVGSASYELMAADLAAKGSGTSLAEGLNAVAFGNAIVVMTLAVTWTFMLNFMIKGVLKKVKKMKNKSNFAWSAILISCLFMSLLVVFIGPMVGAGMVTLMTLLMSVLLTYLQSLLIKYKKMEWLKGFQMSFSMIGAMAFAVVLTGML